MPYFTDLQALVNQVSEWADLRHEQGLKVEPTLKRLRAQIVAAQKALEKAQPSKAAMDREPNGLEQIRALRPKGPRRIWKTVDVAALKPRLRGAWLGRAAGCTLGVPVEAWSVEKMEQLAKRHRMAFPPTDYWTGHPEPEVVHYGTSLWRDYLKGNIRCIPVDDDLAYTTLGLLILEKYGPKFTTADVGKAWVDWLPIACTAEDVALKNLKAGIPASKAAEKGNPYQEWIGADIRSDPWAYAAPGWPEKAAELAYRDAYLSHRQNGLYGAMYFAAAISAAFVVDNVVDALKIGLTEIPRECRLAADIRWALALAPKLKDWRAARAAVDKRFAGMHVVHTNNNACLTVFGLILGKHNFTRTIGMTVAMGLDNDCTGATAGSLLGAVIGLDRIPEHWWKPFRNKQRAYLNGHEWFSNTDLVERYVRVAKAVAAAG